MNKLYLQIVGIVLLLFFCIIALHSIQVYIYNSGFENGYKEGQITLQD